MSTWAQYCERTEEPSSPRSGFTRVICYGARPNPEEGFRSLDQAAESAASDRCGQRMHVELAVDRTHLRVDGVVRDEQLLRRLTLAPPSRQRPEDLQLASGQRPAGRRL